MHPELIRIGPLVFRSYGALLALSLLIGIFWSVRRAKKVGVNSKYILDLAIVVFVSSILGARVFYVVFHLEEFKGHWLDVISPVQSTGDLGIGGLTLLGGVILSILSGIWYLKIKRQNIWKVADVVAPAFPLGIFLTRVGCFLNGCCFGKPHQDGIFGVAFPASCPAGYTFPGTELYPTQIFSSFKGLVVLLVLLFLERFKKFEGYSFWLMLFLFAVGRFIIDFYRYYEPSMILTTIGGISFSVNQGISFIILLLALLMWNLLRKRSYSLSPDDRTNKGNH